MYIYICINIYSSIRSRACHVLPPSLFTLLFVQPRVFNDDACTTQSASVNRPVKGRCGPWVSDDWHQVCKSACGSRGIMEFPWFWLSRPHLRCQLLSFTFHDFNDFNVNIIIIIIIIITRPQPSARPNHQWFHMQTHHHSWTMPGQSHWIHGDSQGRRSLNSYTPGK